MMVLTESKLDKKASEGRKWVMAETGVANGID